MAASSPTTRSLDPEIRRKAADQADGHRTMAVVRLLVLAAVALFLIVLGASVAVSLTQPFARAILVAALALPVVALAGLILRSWTALTRR